MGEPFLQVKIAEMGLGMRLACARNVDSQTEYLNYFSNVQSLHKYCTCVVAGNMIFWLISFQQWILNNVIGLAFCMNAIELISLDTVSVGCLLLGGLFLYDIFWVFGTDVMVTVAKGLEVPIKCKRDEETRGGGGGRERERDH